MHNCAMPVDGTQWEIFQECINILLLWDVYWQNKLSPLAKTERKLWDWNVWIQVKVRTSFHMLSNQVTLGLLLLHGMIQIRSSLIGVFSYDFSFRDFYKTYNFLRNLEFLLAPWLFSKLAQLHAWHTLLSLIMFSGIIPLCLIWLLCMYDLLESVLCLILPICLPCCSLPNSFSRELHGVRVPVVLFLECVANFRPKCFLRMFISMCMALKFYVVPISYDP